jgi:hypothetical protein
MRLARISCLYTRGGVDKPNRNMNEIGACACF